MEWVNEYKVYVIVIFYIFLFTTLFSLGAFVRLASGEGLFGRFGYEQIPPRLRWMPIVATVASFFMVAYSFMYIVYPDIQNYYLPVTALQNARISLFGMVLTVIGSVVFVASQLQLGRSYRLNQPTGRTSLVTTGLYSVSRNPLYMGLYTALFGVFLMLPNWLFLASLIFFIINYHFKIVVLEEPALEEMFGDSYREYCRRVNRYF